MDATGMHRAFDDRRRIRMTTRPPWAVSVFLVLVLLTLASGQTAPRPERVEIPKMGILQGVPTIRIDSAEDRTTRQVLDPAEASQNPLKVRVRDGRFYWASHDNRPLQAYSSGAYTFLTSDEPGSYIRLTMLDNKISYLEHIDLKERGCVTWWGEIKVFVGP
jgi:hypothetical protein